MSSGPGSTSPVQPPKDFFVSYTGGDRTWAEWIAFTLEEAGYTTVIQAWDSRPGMNFVAMMHNATKQTERTIAVLSAAYLKSEFGFTEWAVAFRRDPAGKQQLLVPIRIEACDVQGLLGPIVYVDLVGLDETQAKERLLAGIKPGRAKPLSAGFPRSALSQMSGPVLREHPLFPGTKITTIENQGLVQGQVIGDHPTVHMHFHDPVKSAVPAPVSPPQRLWNIPYPRNPFFTGRIDLLTQLAATLHTNQPIALSQPQAISGLGGIGKTQIAIEYAYRHLQDYQFIFWGRAENQETLNASYQDIATLLNLPEQEAQEQQVVIQAVTSWLQTHQRWLLILDNADEPEILRPFLPKIVSGHLLLTTRAADVSYLGLGFGHGLVVEAFSPEQGTLFLLHRAGLLGLEVAVDHATIMERTQAVQIGEELGWLPLALDQAGAYIKATQIDLATYQQRYQQHRTHLLKERQGREHPEPVVTTWALSFQRVEEKNAAAADLLRLCAFLAPDAISEDMITTGATLLSGSLARAAKDLLLFDQAIEVLRAYSLLRRDPSHHHLSMHRLVQTVLRDAMKKPSARQWARSANRLVNNVFPRSGEFDRWGICADYLPHVLKLFSSAKSDQFIFPETADLLRRTGWYLGERGQLREAEDLLVHALKFQEQRKEQDEQEKARAVLALAWLYERQGKYDEAEPLFLLALRSMEQRLGPEHREIADCLNNLAVLYESQGKRAQAEPLYVRALAICEQQLGALHPRTASSLNNLAVLYKSQGKYAQAEPLYVRALTIREQQLGAEHPDTAQSLNNLAALYESQRKDAEAEPLYMRALAINEQQLGAEHPDTATSLNNLAALYENQGKYAEAEPLFQRAFTIREQVLGTAHPDTAQSLWWLAVLSEQQQHAQEAKGYYERALLIYERTLGGEHPRTQSIQQAYTTLLEIMKQDKERYN